jgi:hypothetical protein
MFCKNQKKKHGVGYVVFALVPYDMASVKQNLFGSQVFPPQTVSGLATCVVPEERPGLYLTVHHLHL